MKKKTVFVYANLNEIDDKAGKEEENAQRKKNSGSYNLYNPSPDSIYAHYNLYVGEIGEVINPI